MGTAGSGFVSSLSWDLTNRPPSEVGAVPVGKEEISWYVREIKSCGDLDLFWRLEYSKLGHDKLLIEFAEVQLAYCLYVSCWEICFIVQ